MSQSIILGIIACLDATTDVDHVYFSDTASLFVDLIMFNILHVQALRSIVTHPSMTQSEAAGVIVREKKISSTNNQ